MSVRDVVEPKQTLPPNRMDELNKEIARLWQKQPAKKEQPAKKPATVSDLRSRYAENLRRGKKYKNINEARKEAEDALGPVESGTEQAKQVDEIMEQAIVQEAQRIAQHPDLTDEQKFNHLTKLYNNHPRLGTRTGKQMKNQAFSTPAPLAWLTNVMADVQPGDTVYDSSAGNGMLLIGADNAIANEIDPDRASTINADEVTSRDATEHRPNKQADKVIINPPFSTVTRGGKKQKWEIEGVKTDQVDHAITLNSLPAMKDDGRAVIIINARGMEKGQPKADQPRAKSYVDRKPFYNHIYDNYNVVDHFTVNGGLYAKQGAKQPVDVIVIDGKGQSSRPKPYNFKDGGLPQFYSSWEDLRDDKLRRNLLDTGGQHGVGDRGQAGRGNQRRTVEEQDRGDAQRPGGDSGQPAGGTGGRVDQTGGVPTSRTGEREGTAGTSGVSGRAGEARDDTARDRGGDVEETRPAAEPEDVGEGTARADQGLSSEERSEAERMMDEALDRKIGQEESKPKKPQGQPKKPQGQQKKPLGQKKESKKSSRKAQAEAKKQEAQDEFKEAWQEFTDAFGTELDPSIAKKCEATRLVPWSFMFFAT